jgi:hypothetical protein
MKGQPKKERLTAKMKNRIPGKISTEKHFRKKLFNIMFRKFPAHTTSPRPQRVESS